MSERDLFCPRCGETVRLREGASRRTGKLIYCCRRCERNFGFRGSGASLVEEPGVEDSGERTVRIRRPAAMPRETVEGLREMRSPSESDSLPEGIALILEFVDGPQRGRNIRVSHTRSILGREVGDIRVDDPLVSGKHAILDVYDLDTVILKDLSSTNGTYHNGRLIDHCKLSDGDELRLGSSILNVIIDPTS
jgi:hypothetical protein